MMGKFREKMSVLMQGRYGMDQLGKVLNYGTLILLAISLIFRSNITYVLGIIGLVISYYRTFSRNFEKRYQENQKFLNLRYKLICQKSKIVNRFHDGKTHRIYKCPNCNQKVRVPKGKGKICIKCPKCRIEFIKKT